MSSPRVLIVSDVHLLDLEDSKGRHFFSFLKQNATDVDRIYVLGDLFDVWPGTSRLLIQKFQPLLDFFSEYIQRGGEIHYIEGNHDFQLGKLPSQLGFKVYQDEIRENWDGKEILFCHGDTVNQEDTLYLKVRRFFRSPWFLAVRAIVPDRLAVYLGTTASRISRESQQKRPDAEARRERVKSRYRAIAKELTAQGPDVLVMGHTHVPDDFIFENSGRTCRYLNSGDWVRSYTFIRYEAGEFRLLNHPVSAS